MAGLNTLSTSPMQAACLVASDPVVQPHRQTDATHILFVDDQQELLVGLRRLFQSFQKDWEVRFARGAEEALRILDEWAVHVVVSDMRMPGMDGAELLDEIRRRHPSAVRIMLSGQSDEAGLLRAVAPVHQYLAKPCSPEQLHAVISRVCTFRNRLADPALIEFISNLTSLPSVPQIYSRMQEELESPESTVSSVAELVSQDAAISCKLLQIVNSSFFGLPRRATSPAHAARLLGLERLRLLVLSAGIFSQYNGIRVGGLTIEEIMEHSIATAACARALMELQCPGRTDMAEEASLASILHCVGQLILMQNRGEEYGLLVERARSEQMLLHELEVRHFNVSHAALGGYLLELWGLPDVIAEAVTFHHTPMGACSETFDVLAAVHIADALVHEQSSNGGDAWMALLDEEFVRHLGLEELLPKWRDVVSAKFQGAAS